VTPAALPRPLARERVRRTPRRLPRPGRRYFGTEKETERVRQLPERLAPVAGPGCCPVCTQALSDSDRRPRRFCTTWCRDREKVLRRRELLSGGLRPLLPAPRKQCPDSDARRS
jgi:hypothetical protein